MAEDNLAKLPHPTTKYQQKGCFLSPVKASQRLA